MVILSLDYYLSKFIAACRRFFFLHNVAVSVPAHFFRWFTLVMDHSSYAIIFDPSSYDAVEVQPIFFVRENCQFLMESTFFVLNIFFYYFVVFIQNVWFPKTLVVIFNSCSSLVVMTIISSPRSWLSLIWKNFFCLFLFVVFHNTVIMVYIVEMFYTNLHHVLSFSRHVKIWSATAAKSTEKLYSRHSYSRRTRLRSAANVFLVKKKWSHVFSLFSKIF